MVSFYKLWQTIQNEPLVHEDSSINSVIQTGLNLDEDFWDKFISVCNNADGMASLLGVTSEQVMSWGNIIKSELNKAKSDNTDDSKTKVIDTGGLK